MLKLGSDIAGAKATLDLLTPQDRQQQALLLVAERIQRAATLTLKGDRVAGAVQDLRAGSGICL
jgi:hypothetical protein